MNRLSFILPVAFSAVAFLVVIANVLAGTPPQPDENASAHVFQLLIVAQLPLIGLFLATADWRGRSAALLFAVQLAALCLALLPVWLAGY